MQVTINVPDDIPRHELQLKIKEFEESLASELRKEQEKGDIKSALNKLRSKGTFKGIQNPSSWQKDVRRDRDLPYR